MEHLLHLRDNPEVIDEVTPKKKEKSLADSLIDYLTTQDRLREATKKKQAADRKNRPNVKNLVPGKAYMAAEAREAAAAAQAAVSKKAKAKRNLFPSGDDDDDFLPEDADVDWDNLDDGAPAPFDPNQPSTSTGGGQRRATRASKRKALKPQGAALKSIGDPKLAKSGG